MALITLGREVRAAGGIEMCAPVLEVIFDVVRSR